VRCPLCGRSARRFNPLPDAYTTAWEEFGCATPADRWETLNLTAYSCPTCGASDRDRLIWLFAKPWLDVRRSARVLDIAPMPSLAAQLSASQHVYLRGDVAAAAVDVTMDICALPFPDQTLDLVICSHVLEHVVDDGLAMRELCRVLTPRGRGLVLVPIPLDAEAIEETTEPLTASESWRRFAQDDHVRLYSRVGLVERLRLAGLQVSCFDRAAIGRRALRRAGLTRTSTLYVVERADVAAVAR